MQRLFYKFTGDIQLGEYSIHRSSSFPGIISAWKNEARSRFDHGLSLWYDGGN